MKRHRVKTSVTNDDVFRNVNAIRQEQIARDRIKNALHNQIDELVDNMKLHSKPYMTTFNAREYWVDLGIEYKEDNNDNNN